MSHLQYVESGLLALAEIAILIRAILRPHRDPASRLAWVVVIVVLPIAGIIAYLLLGEIRISNARRERGREVDRGLPHARRPTSACAEALAKERLCRAVRAGALASTSSARPVATARCSPSTAMSRSTSWSRTSTPPGSMSICAPTSGWRTITAARSRMR